MLFQLFYTGRYYPWYGVCSIMKFASFPKGLIETFERRNKVGLFLTVYADMMRPFSSSAVPVLHMYRACSLVLRAVTTAQVADTEVGLPRSFGH